MEDLISVLIPVYQAKEYLEECMDSVLNQSYQNIEVVLVDDGSTDGSEIICENYAKANPNVKVIHQENGGLPYSRNVGIDNAQGDYIAFLDADDIWHPQFLEHLLGMIKKYDADIAQCDFLMVRDKDDILMPQENEHIDVYSARQALGKSYKDFETVRYVVVWNKLYKKAIFDDVRFLSDKTIDDAYTTHKLYWNANRIAVSNLYLHYYRQSASSMMGRKYDLWRLDSIEAGKEKCAFFKDKGLSNEYYEMSLSYYRNLWHNYRLVEENIDNADDILSRIREEIKREKNEILQLKEGSLREKIRAFYADAPEEEREYYRNIYGKRVTYKNINTYLFPFNIIEKNAKVAIFGAGGVGKAYYEQITESDFCQLVLWVDNLWSNYVKEGYDVKPIKELWNVQYDVLIIAVQSKKMAEEIKVNLLNWGLEEDKIKWEFPDNRQETENELIQYSLNIPNSEKNRLFLLDTADYGNLGDQALADQGLKFLKDYFPEYEIIEVSGRQWDLSKKHLISKINPKDVLFFVGGGFMGDLWPLESERIKDMIRSFPLNRKVFLPQSFFYDAKNKKENMESDKQLYLSDKRILFIHREKYSYDLCSRIIAKEHENLLFPDMVLYSDYQIDNHSRNGIIGCLRMDKEKVNFEIDKELYEYCKENEMDYSIVDTSVEYSVSRDQRKEELHQLLTEFSEAELVVTDRLHGMLFAAVTNTPCLAFDNISKKVSGVYEWIKDIGYVKMVSVNANLKSEIESMLKLDRENRILPKAALSAQFERMSSEIKEWLNIF